MMSNLNGRKAAAGHPPPNVGDVVTCVTTQRAYQIMEITNTVPKRVKLLSVKRNASNDFDRDMVAIDLIWQYYLPTWR